MSPNLAMLMFKSLHLITPQTALIHTNKSVLIELFMSGLKTSKRHFDHRDKDYMMKKNNSISLRNTSLQFYVPFLKKSPVI